MHQQQAFHTILRRELKCAAKTVGQCRHQDWLVSHPNGHGDKAETRNIDAGPRLPCCIDGETVSSGEWGRRIDPAADGAMANK